MITITDEMKDVVENTKLFSVATASAAGEPNVVPIAFARLMSEDEFLLMDNFMEKTEANLKENPRAAISCWNLDAQTNTMRAYQFKGDVRFVYSGEIFEEGCRWVTSRMPHINPKAAVILKVTDIYNLEPHKE